ncbi:hypothetical protein IEQ34_021629 [Dendrobium chrysotoxum]|uniref:Uncharacterized protein n=1 Tax=Dendrobium chrysotoxum TaxID=161865 RepID=A0AAV7G5A8_DENCH|nr:hypothetical protein IEQ34_021629 [Dendrobium chrysotoxum]
MKMEIGLEDFAFSAESLEKKKKLKSFSSLDDHQILAEAKLWVRDLKQSPKRSQNVGRKETKAWWWSGDYSCVKKRRPVHNSLDP